jgi:hypothetical protein
VRLSLACIHECANQKCRALVTHHPHCENAEPLLCAMCANGGLALGECSKCNEYTAVMTFNPHDGVCEDCAFGNLRVVA